MFFRKIISDLRLAGCRLMQRLGLSRGVHYIGGADTLPPPLTAEEETDILSRLDEDAGLRRVLVERNLRLVVYIARKFENTGVGIEDLISIGTIGLIKAANTFRLDKNIKLATYASRCIENEILMYIRKNQNLRFEMSLEAPLSADWDGNELILSDILESDGVKAHHNVGGLPEDLNFELVEPVKFLYKDEVRVVGKALGLPDNMVYRQPFPGPGLGVRCVGAITRDRLEALRESDAILREEFA